MKRKHKKGERPDERIKQQSKRIAELERALVVQRTEQPEIPMFTPKFSEADAEFLDTLRTQLNKVLTPVYTIETLREMAEKIRKGNE